MKLSQYLRVIIHNKVRPLFIKNKCEHCDNKEDLHLHHVKLFVDIMDESINELNLEYKDTNEYSDLELSLLTNVVLGKHLQIEYLTLCPTCHDLIHEKDMFGAKNRRYAAKKKLQKDLEENKRINEIVSPQLKQYLDSIVDKKLFDKEQQELSNFIIDKNISNKVDYRTKKLKPLSIEHIINQLELPYIVSKSKRGTKGEMRGKRYIIISKK